METQDMRRAGTFRPAPMRAAARAAALATTAALAGILAGCSGKTDPDFLGSAVVEAETFQATITGRVKWQARTRKMAIFNRT